MKYPEEIYHARAEELKAALRDVLVYCPDYMHGMPKKHYEEIAYRGHGKHK